MEGRFSKQVACWMHSFHQVAKGGNGILGGWGGVLTAPRVKYPGRESPFSSLRSWQQPDPVERAQAEGRGVPIPSRTRVEWICRYRIPSDPNLVSRGSPPVPRGYPASNGHL